MSNDSVREAGMFDVLQTEAGTRLRTDPSRDALLTDFGKATLLDRYLLPDESFQDLFARVALYYADDSDQLEFGSVPAELLVKFAELLLMHATLVLFA